MESFIYEITTDKKYLDIPTVEDLLHVSFRESNLKLREVPECLIVKLPRHQKKNKPYDWIIPSLEMDISFLIDNPHPCVSCGTLAWLECQDCKPEFEDDNIIQTFCQRCYKSVHQCKSKRQHHTNSLAVSRAFVKKYQEIAKRVNGEDEIASATQHLYERKPMELFSVVCIEECHYIAFVKSGSGNHAQWVFFDSMADRRGDGQHRYNIPEVTHLRDFEALLRREYVKDALKGPKVLPKFLKRILSNGYICFYSPTKSGS